MTRSKKLNKDEASLWLGNGASVVVVAIGTVYLVLESGIKLDLNDCFYVPDIIKNIISVLVLDKECFNFTIFSGLCSIFKNGLLYGISALSNNLYTGQTNDSMICL